MKVHRSCPSALGMRGVATALQLLLAVVLSSPSTADAFSFVGHSKPMTKNFRTTSTASSSPALALQTTPLLLTSPSSSTLSMNFLSDVGDFFKGLSMRATASHILIKGGAEAATKLEDVKVEIDDNPVKFAEMAREYSECPSGRNGGNLGEFGRGQMVKEFDQVVFNDDVGVVHGPIKTQFGYHLILINERTPE